ncbi:hypothetical protein ACEN4K_03725 [Marinilactibacillus psychrotolerans]|uniref:hypothetical protein n=1 Tax=Marinilactibacillus psychrotolerans TaxID=191770 RepID=UPI003887D3C6
MNAQEAIKVIHKTDPDLLTEEYCEALSIILESAKFLHDELKPEFHLVDADENLYRPSVIDWHRYSEDEIKLIGMRVSE